MTSDAIDLSYRPGSYFWDLGAELGSIDRPFHSLQLAGCPEPGGGDGSDEGFFVGVYVAM